MKRSPHRSETRQAFQPNRILNVAGPSTVPTDMVRRGLTYGAISYHRVAVETTSSSDIGPRFQWLWQCQWPRQCQWICALLISTLMISVLSADPVESEAEVWRRQQLLKIAEKIQSTPSKEDQLEYAARKSWLERWRPGQMAPIPAPSESQSTLVDEPALSELKRPSGIKPTDWEQMVSSQSKLFAVDTDEDRKNHLRAIIEAARQLEESLTDRLPAELQRLPEPTAWALAYVRYRLGRALAYRELTSVRERWPISDPAEYEKRLLAAYQRLLDQTKHIRPEFILLEDRILRRSGRKGRALQLLESNQSVIEAKWYLKKRRDLLKELGWGPPHQEAARIYFDAGYRDEP